MKTGMHKPFTAFSLTALLAILILTACGTPAAAPTSAPAHPTAGNAAIPTTAASLSEASASPTMEASAPSAGAVSFSRDLLPLFNETCIKCHGGDKTEKGLDMKSYSSLMAGSERGLVVMPGDATGSKLAQLVIAGKMPKRGPKLSSEQVQLIIDWINAGAQNN